jgi:pyrroline-5-carboxylate reductase
MRITIIGGGNMATSLIGGLCAQGVPPARITVTDPVQAQLDRLHLRFGVNAMQDNVAAVRDADAVVLAVKPQEMSKVAHGVAAAIQARRRLVISIAAGIRLQDLARWLGPDVPLVRTMPNRPALIGAGITALYAREGLSAAERSMAEQIMAACGATVWLVAEEEMDVVTALSGTGPAYFFLLIEALEAAGIQLGLAPETARQLAVQTASGSGRMAAESGEAPTELRLEVTSKGGTTVAAMQVLEGAGVRAIFAEAVAAAARRSAELARQFGGD